MKPSDESRKKKHKSISCIPHGENMDTSDGQFNPAMINTKNSQNKLSLQEKPSNYSIERFRRQSALNIHGADITEFYKRRIITKSATLGRP